MRRDIAEKIDKGEIKNLKDLALTCVVDLDVWRHVPRNSKEYVPLTPHYDEQYVEEMRTQLANFKANVSEDSVYQEWKTYYETQISKIELEIKVAKRRNTKIKKLLKELNVYTAPTPKHLRFKGYMREYLETDDLSFSKKRLAEYKTEYNNLMENPKQWVQEHIAWRIEDYKNMIESRKEAYEKSIENCKITNDWVDKLMESLK